MVVMFVICIGYCKNLQYNIPKCAVRCDTCYQHYWHLWMITRVIGKTANRKIGEVFSSETVNKQQLNKHGNQSKTASNTVFKHATPLLFVFGCWCAPMWSDMVVLKSGHVRAFRFVSSLWLLFLDVKHVTFSKFEIQCAV